jgi:hypothetical protein
MSFSALANAFFILLGLYIQAHQLYLYILYIDMHTGELHYHEYSPHEIADNMNLHMVPNTYFKHFPSVMNLLSHNKYKSQSIGLHTSRHPMKLTMAYISFLVMMQAGDLHPNPGPRTYKPKFPCVLCDKAAKWGQRAISCDDCNEWYHVECMNMSTIAYNIISESNQITWICCQCGIPNFTSSLFSNADIELSNSFSCLSTNSNASSNASSSCSELPCSPLASSTPNTNKKPTDPTNRKSKAKPRRQKLKVLVVNFQGIRSKVSDLELCISNSSPDIIIGTETHLDDSVNSSELFPPDFSIIRKDRDFATKGGVLIAIRNNLIATHRTDLDSNCEIVWVTIELQGAKKITIGAFYRSQNVGSSPDYLDQLRESLSKINTSRGGQIWLAGDFNFPGIDWESQSLKPNAQYAILSRQMLEIAADFGLDQVVTEPTRINNILDIFLTNNASLVERCWVSPGISDHDGIPTIIINSKPRVVRHKPRKIYDYKKANISSIKSELKEFSDKFISSDIPNSVNVLFDKFNNKIKSVMNEFIPSRMVSKRNLTPWISRNINRLLRRKKRAYNRYRKKPNHDTLGQFQDLRKLTQKTTRKSYRKYVKDVCLESPKKFWSFVKSLKTDSVGIPALKKEGKLESNNNAKATILNNQFKSVFTQENPNLPTEPTSAIPSMPDFIITTEGVTKLLLDLNPHKASGPDDIPAQILKIAAEEIAPALSYIFQRSLDTGSVPSSWLCANISPIFKKGDRSDASNYRPVSLTSICSKILEHIIHSQIMNHFDKFSILTNKQHGFRAKHSCEAQLILTVNDLALSLNNKSQTDMVIMDFAKAFDTVPHNRLLLKLNRYGIRNKTHAWITSFLKSRKQRVVVGGEHSSWTEVVSGVPQGTVLGPLLFLAYINDLPQNITSQVRLFADDCVIYRQIKNDHDHNQLQDDLHTLERWEEDWQMRFNVKKCFIMRITHVRNPKIFQYTLGGIILEETKCHTYLGVHITDNLSWSKHINKITSSANRSLGFVRRNLYSCTKPIKQTAYMSLVRPLLEYSSSVWDPHQKDLINKLNKVQRRAARFVSNDYQRKSSVDKMLKDLNWSSLETRRKATCLSVLHKARHDLLALPVNQLLQPVRRQSRHSHPDAYQILTATKDCYKYSYFPKTVLDWNNLPHPLTQIQSPPAFKSAVIKHYEQQLQD